VEQLFQDDAPTPGTLTPGTLAVDRSAQLLLGVLASEHPVSVTELARRTGLPKSTSSRLLRVLVRRGLVGQDGPRGLIHAGPALLTYARRGLYERTIVELAQRSLDALAQASGETVNLAVPGAAGVEHLAQVDGRHFLGTGHWIGRRVDFHASAVGKVFLAHGAAELPDGPLAAPAPAAVTDRAALAAQLREARTRGYALAIDELEDGLAAVAAPVHGGGGDVVAALAISGPTLRMGPEEIARLVPVLKLEARRLSRRLGHTETGEHAA
jgi:IclR family transcriptional regulator, acetate operon repressor